MKGNWLKLHRELQDHWVNKRPEWFMGWCHILMATAHKTGEANLTEVYRGMKDHFSKAAWRHFVHKLEQDKMIEILSVENLGQDVGFRQTAVVVNFFDYQAKPEQESGEKSHAANNTASTQPTTQPNPANSGTDKEATRSQQHSQHAANNTVLQEVKEVKEVKDLKPNTSNFDEKAAHNVGSRQRAPVDYQEFVDVYNEHCGTLPSVSALNSDRRRKIKSLVKEHGHYQALSLLADATKQVASDSFWRERHYNLDNLLRNKVLEKAEKWRARQEARRSATAGRPARNAPPGETGEYRDKLEQYTRLGL